jgi:hypothetical protein
MNDAARFTDVPYLLVSLISAPFKLFASLYMLYNYIGVSALIGLIIFIVFIPFNVLIAKLSKIAIRKRLESVDKRLKLMNELFSAVRVIKFYGWEISVRKIISNARLNEIKNFMRYYFIDILSTFSWDFAPFIYSSISFGSYLYMNENAALDANTAFISLTLFSMIKSPMGLIPYIIMNLIQVL